MRRALFGHGRLGVQQTDDGHICNDYTLRSGSLVFWIDNVNCASSLLVVVVVAKD